MSTPEEIFERRALQLTKQNENFKRLLTLTKEIEKKKSMGLTRLCDESKFIKQTLLFLDHEKEKINNEKAVSIPPMTKNFLQNLIDKIPQSDISRKIQTLEAENIEMRRKLILLLEKQKHDSMLISDLRRDQEMLRNILLEPTKTNFIGILQVPGENIRVPKLINIEDAKAKIKKYLISRVAAKKIQSNFNDGPPVKLTYENIKPLLDPQQTFHEIEYQINLIKKQVENEYHVALSNGVSSEIPEASIILELEKERTSLLDQLQQILEESTKQIAEEYCKLQDKITYLEKEKDQLQIEVDTVLSNKNVEGDVETSKQSLEQSLKNLMELSLVEKDKGNADNMPQIPDKASKGKMVASASFTEADESKMLQNVMQCSIM